mgnify:CR=1 FL=1
MIHMLLKIAKCSGADAVQHQGEHGWACSISTCLFDVLSKNTVKLLVSVEQLGQMNLCAHVLVLVHSVSLVRGRCGDLDKGSQGQHSLQQIMRCHLC